MQTIRLFIDWLARDPWRVAFAGAAVVAAVFLIGLLVVGFQNAAAASASVATLAAGATEKSRRTRKASRVQRAAARAAQRGADARNRNPEPRAAADLNDRWGDL